MRKTYTNSFPLSIKETLFLLLLLFGIFLFLSLVSYNSGDLKAFVYPPQDTANLGGKVGAQLSHFLFFTFGSASFFLMIYLLFVGITGFIQNEYKNTPIKIISAIVMIITLSIIFQLTNFTAFLPHSFYKNNGGGGIIGRVLADILIQYFGISGTVLLSSYLLVLSSIIATNGMILSLFIKAINGIYSISLIIFNYLLPYLITISKHLYKKISQLTKKKLQQKQYHPARYSEELSNKEEIQESQIFSSEKTPSTEQIISKNTLTIATQTIKTPSEPKEPVSQKEDIKSEDYSPPSKDYEAEFSFPPLSLLDDKVDVEWDRENSIIEDDKETLKNTLASFNIECKVVGAEKGPSVTTYELELQAGTRLQKVLSVADDIAIALRAPSVRIIAPIPGKSTIGIEVPNVYKNIVTLKELLQHKEKYTNYKLPLFLGKSASGEPIIEDLTEFPHLLIAGTTGSGKSVCINSIIIAFLYLKTPKNLKLILIDPKVVELTFYNDIPHLFCPVVTDVAKAKKIFQWLINEMDERYELFSKIGVKKIEQYNKMAKEEIIENLKEEGEETPIIKHPLEYLVCIVDELNDLMMAANKEIESYILRLSQKARAVGIHLILATQRPSVDVITGLIKANIPARISFKVVSKVDSRTILDRIGAEKLLGKGDMLFLKPGAFDLIRIQGCYISEKDIERVSEYWKQFKIQHQENLEVIEEIPCSIDDEELPSEQDDEELLEKAIEIVLQSKRGSVSLVQRKLGIGYCRAARLIEKMAELGYLGEYRGAKPREVLISYEEYLQKKRKN